MPDDEGHLSDEELVLAADQESGRKAKKAQAHIDTCVRCRNRAAEFESLIVDFAHAQKDSVDAGLPSIAGSRAILRARMSQMPASAESFFSRSRLFQTWLTWALSLTAMAMVVAVAMFVEHRNFPATGIESAGSDIRPNRAFTPGMARQVSLDKVCSLPQEEVIKQVSPLQRQRVFKEYGIPFDQADKYEVDYLVTPGLGGDDDIRNLWPEPYSNASWNAHVKDALEERLHELVCAHQLDLAEAQRAIATDWVAAYEKYVRPSRSNTPIVGRSSTARQPERLPRQWNGENKQAKS
jgi:hypothetical protein